MVPYFRSPDGDFLRGFDADLNLGAVVANEENLDVVTDLKGLSGSPGEN
jgi:hypothetical protein